MFPIGCRSTVPMPATMRSVPSAVWNFKVFGKGIYDVNQQSTGVIWSIAPESKIQKSQGSDFSTETTSVRILWKIKFLPELATVVDPITGEDLASSASNYFILFLKRSISPLSPEG